MRSQREVVPLSDDGRRMVLDAVRSLAPFEAEIARRWEMEYDRVINGAPGRKAVEDYAAAVHLFCSSLADGDFGAYFERIEKKGSELAKTREQYEDLILSFHLYEDATLPVLKGRFGERILEVMDELDHLYHNVIAILARSYFRELERERETYYHVLAHDMKNMLTAISGSAALLTRYCRRKPFLEEAVTRQAEMVSSRIEGIVRVLDGLLDYGRASAGKTAVFSRFDLGEAALEAVRLHLPPEVGARLLVTIDGKPLAQNPGLRRVFVDGDRGLVVRAIGNYLSNAAKYARSLIAIAIDEQESEMVVSVRDDGRGLPADQLERVFDDYYQAPGGRPGTGLGLPSVRLIARSLGGKAWVESRPGEGCTFRLSLARKIRAP